MCNHYFWYLHWYEGITEIYENETELKKEEWIKFFDARHNYGHLFNFCPKCWAKINSRDCLKYVKQLWI